MQYDLDPRLLPPSGASVQCTRCSFVFTAMPTGEVVVPNQPQSAQAGPAPKAGEAPRPAVGTTTRVFGSPYAVPSKPGGPGTQPQGASLPSLGKTQVFGAAPQPLPAAANTQVFGAPSIPAKTPSVATTQVFGAASIPQQPPSATTTQVFGAASIPQPPPSSPVTTTQVFGAPAVAAKAPSVATTQVFGAASVPQPAPSPATTQVFGAPAAAAKAPSVATTQVFGAASVPLSQPTTATTQTFGAAEVQAARRAAEGAAPALSSGSAPAPWLAEPGPAPVPPRSTASEHPPSVTPAPSVELPEEPVALSGGAPSPFPPEPSMARSGAFASSQRSAPIDLPPELVAPSRAESPKPAAKETSGGGGWERVLLILGAVVALGLTAWLSYPVWRNQGSELSAEVLTAKDQAVSLLRRDDATAREQAIALLRTLVEKHPKFTEAQAELVVALSLQLDDVKAELELINLEGQRLDKEMKALELAKSPADWQGRISARMEELGALNRQKQPLDAAVAELTKQLQAPLAFIRAAPEAEPSADVVARYKAQAVYESVQGNPQAIGLADRLDKVESPRLWSVVTRVEYGLNAPSPLNALPALADELAQVSQQDKTFFRAYVLGARLALRQNDSESARALLDTVVALNPNHALARKLQQRAAAASPTP
jgi:hypothetical protein